MTNFRNWISLSAMAMSAVVCLCASAQDDLDNLLKELESDVAKPAAKTEAKPAAEEAKPEVAAEEKPAEEAKP